ncbi:MAG: dienelactone hydrolase family protein [Myxococcales bacterium]|nr:dienelactone hydrolase family protein [Myxococcales bacterium]
MRSAASIASCLSLLLLSGACGGASDPPPPGEESEGCDGAKLLSVPADPSARGPWPVGARTVTIGRLRAEIWYPATVGAEAGQATVRYDIRQALNPSQRAIVPDADNPRQDCDCYRDLPLDAAHGPYPVVVFIHGTAGFRHQSVHQATHWASRGFVVIAADHPGLMLGDLLAQFCPDDPSGTQDLAGDVDKMLQALAAPAGELAFLAGRVAMNHVAVVGHSAGGGAAAAASTRPNVRVIASLAGNTVAKPGPDLERVLFMGGKQDQVVSFGQVSTAWMGSATPRDLVGIAAGGHLVFSDLCESKNPAGKDLLAVAQQYNLCGAALAGMLFDCDPAYIPGPRGWEITNYATTAVLEPALQCSTRTAPLSEVSRYGEAETVMQAP